MVLQIIGMPMEAQTPICPPGCAITSVRTADHVLRLRVVRSDVQLPSLGGLVDPSFGEWSSVTNARYGALEDPQLSEAESIADPRTEQFVWPDSLGIRTDELEREAFAHRQRNRH